MQLTAQGADSLGRFQVNIPGSCPCGGNTEVSVKYNSTAVRAALKKQNIDPNLPSLILKRPWEIGVTCGCYARFHRQLAHINEAVRRSTKKTSP